MDQDNQSTTSSQENNDFVSAPEITLPKGGGAIHGIGEKFAANPVTGTGSLSIPIAPAQVVLVSALNFHFLMIRVRETDPLA